MSSLHPREWLRTVAQPTHLRRTGTLALCVGSWLCLVNLGDVLLTQSWSLALGGKVLLNYLTPFLVANVGLLSRHSEHD